jgi:hypothetical protein
MRKCQTANKPFQGWLHDEAQPCGDTNTFVYRLAIAW